MKNFLTLCFSVFKANKGFTFGLIFLFFFGATVMIMTSVVPETISVSFDRFINDYNMSQASIVTDPMKIEVEGLDNSIEGVSNVETQMVLDTKVKIPGDKLKAMRIFSVDDNGFRKYFYLEQTDAKTDEKNVWVNAYFATLLDIHAGDHIDIKTPADWESFHISAVVSTPESSSSCYDDTYWNEDQDFGFMFMPRADFDSVFHTNNLSNWRSFLFDEGLSVEQKDKAIDKACELLGNNVQSSEIYERSKAKVIFDANVDSLSSTCNIFPYVIFIILLVCASLFLNQIINNQRKKIGLLRGLGYKSSLIMWTYVFYVVVITIIAIVLGAIAANYFDEMVAQEYATLFSLPEIYYIYPSKIIFLLITIPLTGIISCLFSTKSITRVDPSEAYGNSSTVTKPYKFKLPIFKNMEVFRKITFSKIFKNSKRLIMTSASIAACIILTFAGIACYHSKNAAYAATFWNRLNYDLLVYVDGQSAIDEINKVEGVSKTENLIVFTDRVVANDKEFNLQVNAIPKDSDLVRPVDINGNRVYSQDGIVLEDYIADYYGLNVGDKIRIKDVDLEITDIANEYFNYIQYISFDTAKKLNYDKPNTVYISLNDGVDEDEIYKTISDIPGFKYMKFLDHQKIVKEDNQKALDLVYYAIIFAAIFIGLIVITNMIIISVNERKYEYSTLIALGTNKKRFLYMIRVENFLQYIIAAVFAAVPCYFLAKVILDSLCSPQQNFPFVEIPYVYIEAFGLSLLYIIIGVIFTYRRIMKLKPTEILSVRE